MLSYEETFRIKAITDRLKKSTSGDWLFDGIEDFDQETMKECVVHYELYSEAGPVLEMDTNFDRLVIKEKDVTFIEHARSDIRFLVDTLIEQQRLIEEFVEDAKAREYSPHCHDCVYILEEEF